MQTVLLTKQRGKLYTDRPTRNREGQETTRVVPRSAHSQQTQLGNATEEGFTSQLRRTTPHQTRKKDASSQVHQATPQNIEQIPSVLGHEFTWSSSPQNSFIFNLYAKNWECVVGMKSMRPLKVWKRTLSPAVPLYTTTDPHRPTITH